MDYFIVDTTTSKIICERLTENEAIFFARLYATAYATPVTIINPTSRQLLLISSTGNSTSWFRSNSINAIARHSTIATKNLWLNLSTVMATVLNQ